MVTSQGERKAKPVWMHPLASSFLTGCVTVLIFNFKTRLHVLNTAIALL